MEVRVVSKVFDHLISDDALSVSLIKEYLRVNHDDEDKKIENIIKNSIEDFEESTGYYLSKANLIINLNYKDSYYRDSRSNPSFADNYNASRVFDRADDQYLFLLPIANIETQKPVSLTTIDFENKSKVFTETELTQIPEDFVFIERVVPLKLRLKLEGDLFKQLKTNGQSQYYKFQVVTTPPLLTGDLKEGLIRLICKTYENADKSIVLNDALISGIYNRYDCNSGL